MSVKDEYIKLMQSQVGYKETGTNITKYSHWFDHEGWQFFNTKKQGAEYCAIVLLWALCQNDVGIGKDKVRTWLGLPTPKNNCAAGVPYLWSYLVKKGYKVDKNQGQPGDFIFFNNNAHVGMIEKVSNGKYYTIEGNKGNMVKRCTYTIGSPTICGVCHPDWSKVETKSEKPVLEPTEKPEPEKPTDPITQKYKVKTNGGTLALRCAPHVKAANIIWMPNKSDITVSGFVKGDSVYGNDQWVRATYKGKTGYCSAKWITKA